MSPKSLKHILVPIDFTDSSLLALECAKTLGQATSMSLELVYVFDFVPHVPFGGGSLKISPVQFRQHKILVERDLRHAARGYPADRVRVQVLSGAASGVLSELSRKKNCSMVVMGTHGYTGVEHVLYGSVAENVTRGSRAPVLTLHKDSQWNSPDRILVPHNLTEYADEALLYALKLAKDLKASVSVIYVASGAPDMVAVSEALDEHLVSLLGKKRAAGIRTVVRNGRPEESILEESMHGRFDMIVLSAHKKPFWKDVVVGMTAERVLRHSTVPVLAVPCRAPQSKKG